MNSKKETFISVAKALGPVLVVSSFVAAVLYPSRPFQLASLGLATFLLISLAVLAARRRAFPAVWSDVLTLLFIGASIWWIVWVPYLFLPFSLQLVCRLMGMGLGAIAALGLYRSLPGRLAKLGGLFPALLLALTFILPSGPERWDLGPWTPDEVQFTPHKKLLVRVEEGPVLLYDFPSGVVEEVLGFGPLSTGGPPSFGTTLPGWTFGLAALESEARVRVQTVPPARSWPVGGREYTVQTGSALIALTSGPKSTFLAFYQNSEGKVRVELRDLNWNTVAGPFDLPGFLGAIFQGSWKRILPGLLGDIAVPADARTKLAYLGIGPEGMDVRVLDLTTGERRRIDISRELVEAGGGEKSHIYSLAFSPDGKVLALGLSWEGKGACPGLVWLVDLEGRVLARLLPPTPEELEGEPFVSDLAYSPDGKTIAAKICCFPSRLSLIDVDSGRVRNLPFGRRGYRDIAFSPDGKYLAAAAHDGVYLWRIGR